MHNTTTRPHTVTALLTGILLAALTVQSSAADPTILLDQTYERTYRKGTQSGTFIVPQGAEDVRLTVICGNHKKGSSVSSAIVWLNGKVLLKPRHFNHRAKKISRSLDLSTLLIGEDVVNKVEVYVRGKHRASLQLLVTATVPEPEAAPQEEPQPEPQPVSQPAPQTAPPPASSPPQLVTWYLDQDSDGFGGSVSTQRPDAMGPPPPTGGSQWVPMGGDCQDTNAGIYPGNGC